MGRWTTAWMWLRIAALAACVLVLVWLGWNDLTRLFAYQPAGIDFLPMWAAAHEVFVHPHRVYDFARLTHFEQPLLRDFPFRGLRPFVYPPPALLIFLPFGQAAFVLANAAWTLTGLVTVVWVTATRVETPRVLTLLAMILTPASLLVLATGQITFLIAAMGLAALLSLEARPMLAGVLFGIAGAIKPQALLLLPVALFALGAWRAFAMTALTATLMVATSVVIFGLQAWIDWFAAVSRFSEWAMSAPGLVRGMITPTALGMTMKLDPAALDTWRLVFGLGAIAMVWFVFRRTEEPARRLTALFGGAIFVTPYAMHYDAALLAPAAALIVTRRTGPADWLVAIFASALLCCAAIPHWGAAGVTAFILIVGLTPESAFARRRRIADLGHQARIRDLRGAQHSVHQ